MFCKNCGHSLPENAVYCQNCGEPVSGRSKKDPFSSFTETADFTAEFDSNDIRNHKGMAILSYLGILFLIPLLAAKDSRFTRFHVNQGLVLFLFRISFTVCYKLLSFFLSKILFFFPFWILGVLGNLFFIFLIIFGIVNAYQGRAKKLPVIGEITIL